MSGESIFSVLGPIMIGPSSSHTAGALRIGRAGLQIFGRPVRSVRFLLHGSFAATYKGHGTDRALAAGILGLETDDERIRESLELCRAKGIDVTFEATDLGSVHPNTLEIHLTDQDGDTTIVRGSSIGGGAIEIIGVDGESVNFSGNHPVLLVRHKDQSGMICQITGIIAGCGVNIANLRVSREGKGMDATTLIETDSVVSEDVVSNIRILAGIHSVREISKI